MSEPPPPVLALVSLAAGVLGLVTLGSLVFGLGSGLLTVPGLALPVVAVVTGGIALRRPGARGDRWLAWAGVALGMLGVMAVVAGVVMLANMGQHR
ncbi:MAG TPA: hypothetical protein VF594_04080 [Rubricoccaceae bacterium]|jgi:hypothetical protein